MVTRVHLYEEQNKGELDENYGSIWLKRGSCPQGVRKEKVPLKSLSSFSFGLRQRSTYPVFP